MAAPPRIVLEARERGSGDFVTDIACELPLQAIADLVGFPQADRRQIFEWSNQMMAYDDPDYDTDPAVAAAEILGYAAALGDERKRHPRGDIVSRLVAATDDDVLSSEEFAFFVLILAVAGNETTRNAITHGMQAFFADPGQWDRYKAERPTTTADEVVRFGTPVQYVPTDSDRGRRDRRPANRARPTRRPAVRLRELRRDRVRRSQLVRHRPLSESPRGVRRRWCALLSWAHIWRSSRST